MIFDMYKIYSLEAQKTLLRECSLTPVVQHHRVSFSLEEGLTTLHPPPTPYYQPHSPYST